jgi:aspartate ammonia-lyase
MTLGQILLYKKWISSEQLEETISEAEKSDRPLGEVLLERGLLAQEQLQKALQEQYWRRQGYWVID